MKKKWLRSAAFICSMAIGSLLFNTNVLASEMQNNVIEQEVSSGHSNWWIGNDGVISQIDDSTLSNRISVYCTHSLVLGEVAIHNTNNTGGCTISIYDGKKCTKCGTVFINNYKYSIDYMKCIH